MIAYKANAVRWTNEDGYETLDKIVIGTLSTLEFEKYIRVISYTFSFDNHPDEGSLFFNESMVDGLTLQKIKVKRVVDYEKKTFRYEELEND